MLQRVGRIQHTNRLALNHRQIVCECDIVGADGLQCVGDKKSRPCTANRPRAAYLQGWQVHCGRLRITVIIIRLYGMYAVLCNRLDLPAEFGDQMVGGQIGPGRADGRGDVAV